MAFNFPAFSYIIALIVDAFLIFFSLFHVIAFDELKTDYKNPIDQCNSLNPVRIALNTQQIIRSPSRMLGFEFCPALVLAGRTGILASPPV